MDEDPHRQEERFDLVHCQGSRLRRLASHSALAYMASNGRRDQVLAIISKPGPQLFGYSLWELYYNVSQWTAELFLSKMKKGG